MSEYSQGMATLPTPKRKLPESSSTATYTTAAIVCFLLAFVVFIIAKPTEKTGPPQEQQAQGAALPQGHPDTAHDHDHERPSPEGIIKQLEESLATLREAEKVHPDDPLLRLEMANVLYDLAQAKDDQATFREALASYRQYLEIKPEDVNARTDMAYTLYRTGKLDDAMAELYAVQKANPNHQQSAFNMALMFKEKDQPDSLMVYLRRTAEIDSTTNAGRAALEILGAYREAHP